MLKLLIIMIILLRFTDAALLSNSNITCVTPLISNKNYNNTHQVVSVLANNGNNREVQKSHNALL